MFEKLTSWKKGIKEAQGEIQRKSQTEKETCRGLKYTKKEFVSGNRDFIYLIILV